MPCPKTEEDISMEIDLEPDSEMTRVAEEAKQLWETSKQNEIDGLQEVCSHDFFFNKINVTYSKVK